MSLRTSTAQSRITKISLGVLVAGGALAVASSVIPSTGAWFFQARTGQMVTRTSAMSFNVVNSDGNPVDDSFTVNYDGLAPGIPVTRSFTVRNTGDLTGWLNVSLSKLQSNADTGLDLTKLKYSVNGAAPFSLAQVKATGLNMGQLASNAEKTITITLSLDDDAGSEWQNVSATNAIEISLAQAH